MCEELTVEMIRDLVDLMKKNCIRPRVIKTKKELRIANETDILGYKWKMGDSYYLARTWNKDFFVSYER